MGKKAQRELAGLQRNARARILAGTAELGSDLAREEHAVVDRVAARELALEDRA